MLGSIAGDIIGSRFEHHNAESLDFTLFTPQCRFTDDSVLALALADSLLNGAPFVDKLKEYYGYYPHAGYGHTFKAWAGSPFSEPYSSFGNGSAMRVSPVGFAFDDLETVLKEAERSAAVTHNHPEGIKGAQAVAASIFWARRGCSKDEIRQNVTGHFGYDLDEPVARLHGTYRFDSSCQGSVPQAIIAFLESTSFEDAIRKAIYIGGDSDTIACMAGGIAQAFYGGLPVEIRDRTLSRLDTRLRTVYLAFQAKYQTVETAA